jgi:hypothetical protein
VVVYVVSRVIVPFIKVSTCNYLELGSLDSRLALYLVRNIKLRSRRSVAGKGPSFIAISIRAIRVLGMDGSAFPIAPSCPKYINYLFVGNVLNLI